MACPRCGTHNRAGVAFCQNCGANLRGAAPGYVPPAVAAALAEELALLSKRTRAFLDTLNPKTIWEVPDLVEPPAATH